MRRLRAYVDGGSRAGKGRLDLGRWGLFKACFLSPMRVRIAPAGPVGVIHLRDMNGVVGVLRGQL